jgi:DNA modification methylase
MISHAAQSGAPEHNLPEKTLYGNQSNMDRQLESFIHPEIAAVAGEMGQRAIPFIAKDPILMKEIEALSASIPTAHRFINTDCRNLGYIPDESVHLVVTSPPYWILKTYPEKESQLGQIGDYDTFLEELDRVWQHIHRILVPGGRLVIVVGDVCLPRRNTGRHSVIPLHASIQEHCRLIGFDNLAPIIWYKIANASFESQSAGSFLGKPYEPNAIVKNDIEYILFQRKPGGYRKTTRPARLLSIISEENQKIWFRQIWDLKGASTRNHPAPYPLELAERLIRMFSFVGDTILDPFGGTGTTTLAAARWGRNSISIEIEEDYHSMQIERFNQKYQQPYRRAGWKCS